MLVSVGLLTIRQGYQNLLGVDPAAAFLLLAFVFKFLEAQRIRDALVVVFLGYFCLPIAFLFTQSIVMTIYVLFALSILTIALVKVVKPNDKARGWSDVRQVNLMLLSAAPLMLVLFILVPRIGPLWSVPLPSGQARTGPSDSMSPGDIANLAKSDELAFRVEFDGAIPNTRTLYWRGLVFSDFDGRTWRPTLPTVRQKKEANWINGRNVTDKVSDQSSIQHYRITFEPSYQSWLYALDYPVVSNAEIGLTKQYTLLAKEPLNKRKQYAMESASTLIIDPVLAPEIRKENVNLPKQGNEKAKRFATNIRNKSATDQIFVDEILTYFNQKPFYYSLKPPRLGSDSIDEFLFDTRKGFCEHYAGSFVFLMRAAGIPARIVAGYQGGEVNHEENYLLVHQFDAHAWAEVWLPTRGWIRVDPTAQVAPERIEYGLEEATAYENSFLSDSPFSLLRYRNNRWLSQLRLKLDAIEYDWNRWVLGYNAKQQTDFLRNYFGLVNSEQKTQALVILIILFLLVITVVLVRKDRKEVRNKSDQLYLKFCKLMEKRGLGRGVGEAATDYSLRLAAKFPNDEKRIATVTHLYNYLSYGPKLDEKQRKRIVKRLGNEIKASRRPASRAGRA